MTVLQKDYTPPAPAEALIVALDGPGVRVRSWAQSLSGHVRWVKVGMTTFYGEGPILINDLRGMGLSVFLDLKMHDIPHQVYGAARQLGQLGAGMLTVHAAGGSEMVAAAVKGAREGAEIAGYEPPAILAVTVLTSLDGDALRRVGIREEPGRLVDTMARSAIDAGAQGIVCSPREANWVRGTFGDEVLIVTPGVRPSWAAAGDQVRTMTPHEALRSGASYLVIGRPITDTTDVSAAVQRVLSEME